MTRDEIHAMIQGLAPMVEALMLDGEKGRLRAQAEQTERDLVQARIADALEALAMAKALEVAQEVEPNEVTAYLRSYAQHLTARGAS